MLTTEKEFLLANHKALAKQYPGKFLLIKGAEVHGAFQTYEEAVVVASTKFGAGPCLVRSVEHPEDPPPFNIPVLSLGVPITSHLGSSDDYN